MTDSDSTKFCNGCGQTKSRAEFSKCKKNGYQHRCKACKKAERVANAERYKKRRRETRDAKAEYDKAYNERNRERIRTTKKAYYEANKEKIYAQVRAWQLANLDRVASYRKPRTPEQSRASNNRRRIQLLNAEGSHTPADIRRQHKQQGGKCYWCGCKLDNRYHVDHIIPLSKGGGNGPGNICCSCPFCNLSKRDKMPWEFADRLF